MPGSSAAFGAFLNGNEGDGGQPDGLGGSYRDYLGRYVEGQYEGAETRAIPRSMVQSVSRDRQTLKGDRRASLLSQLTSEQRARQRQGGETAGQVAQAGGTMPTSFSDALDNALRRTKMRSRVQTMGDKAAEQQGLRDRINVAKSSRSREGELINAAGRAAQIREGVNIATSDANQLLKEGQAGLTGTVLGAGLARAMDGRGLSDFFSDVFGGGKKVDIQSPTTGGMGA